MSFGGSCRICAGWSRNTSRHDRAGSPRSGASPARQVTSGESSAPLGPVSRPGRRGSGPRSYQTGSCGIKPLCPPLLDRAAFEAGGRCRGALAVGLFRLPTSTGPGDGRAAAALSAPLGRFCPDWSRVESASGASHPSRDLMFLVFLVPFVTLVAIPPPAWPPEPLDSLRNPTPRRPKSPGKWRVEVPLTHPHPHETQMSQTLDQSGAAMGGMTREYSLTSR